MNRAITAEMQPDTGHWPRHAAGMGDITDIPDFGDVVSPTRLYMRTVERIRQSDMTEVEKAAIIGVIEAQYRAAKAAATELPRSA